MRMQKFTKISNKPIPNHIFSEETIYSETIRIKIILPDYHIA